MFLLTIRRGGVSKPLQMILVSMFKVENKNYIKYIQRKIQSKEMFPGYNRHEITDL